MPSASCRRAPPCAPVADPDPSPGTAWRAWQAWEEACLDPSQARATAQLQVEQAGHAEGHGWLALALVEARSGDAGQALAALQRARSLFEPAQDGHALTLCDEVLAIQLRRTGDHAASMRLLDEIDQRKLAALRPYDRFIGHDSRGMTCKALGHIDQALRHFYASVDAASASALPGATITALCNLGGYLQDLFSLDDARTHTSRALQVAEEARAPAGVAVAAANLIVIHHASGQASQARALVDLLQSNAQALGPGAPQRCRLAMALGHLSVGEIALAQRCLDQCDQEGDEQGESHVFRTWLQARCWLSRSLPERARDLTTRVLANRSGRQRSAPPYDLMELHRAAADACEAVGDLRGALDCVRRAQALYEELVGRSARAKVIALQAGHELATAQRERDLALDSRRSAMDDHRRLAQLNDALQQKIVETQVLHSRLQEQAVRDPLTGLHNRRHLFDVAPGMLELARRNDRPLCVALIDLDHFKLLNDTFGHQAGDAVLQRFATLLLQVLRRSDVICRHGGEEFVAVMPDIDVDGADAVLCRLLDEYQAPTPLDTGTRRLPSCSFSAGIAIFPKHGQTLEQLLSRADRALYRAKSLGRARIERAPGTDFSVLA
jgi:diguanylate cyclase (GGDEF)-like protein